MMPLYTWYVWQNNRLVGYVTAYGQWDALRSAKIRFGEGVFIERQPHAVPSNPADLARVAVVSQK